MKKIVILLFAVALAMPMMAQNKGTKTTAKSSTKSSSKAITKSTATQETKVEDEQLPKVYDEDINAMEQIHQALDEANATGRKVICQVGGNWCPWCLRFANFINKDEEINKVIEENYVYIHVNTSKVNKNAEAMKRLGNPGRFGYPVFVILDHDGHVMQTQSSECLEKDKSYDHEKVLAFFQNWTEKAIYNVK